MTTRYEYEKMTKDQLEKNLEKLLDRWVKSINKVIQNNYMREMKYITSKLAKLS